VKVAYRSWAIAPSLDGIDKELWRQRGIGIFDAPLDEYGTDGGVTSFTQTRNVNFPGLAPAGVSKTKS
jgi:hypothetical protein